MQSENAAPSRIVRPHVSGVPLPLPPYRTTIRAKRSGRIFTMPPFRHSNSASTTGMFILIAGPTSVGKDTTRKGVVERFPDTEVSVSVTTRAPRDNEGVPEVHGIDYHFVDKDGFLRMIDDDLFLEHNTVHEDLYGTLIEPVSNCLAAGSNMITDMDVDGVINVMNRADRLPGGRKSVLTFFLLPPSMEELEKRYRIRAGNKLDEAKLRLRLDRAEREITLSSNFDHQIVSETGKLDEVVATVCGIIEASLPEKPVYAV